MYYVQSSHKKKKEYKNNLRLAKEKKNAYTKLYRGILLIEVNSRLLQLLSSGGRTNQTIKIETRNKKPIR